MQGASANSSRRTSFITIAVAGFNRLFTVSCFVFAVMLAAKAAHLACVVMMLSPQHKFAVFSLCYRCSTWIGLSMTSENKKLTFVSLRIFIAFWLRNITSNNISSFSQALDHKPFSDPFAITSSFL